MNQIGFDKKIFLALIVIIKLALDIRYEIYIYISMYMLICNIQAWEFGTQKHLSSIYGLFNFWIVPQQI